MIGRRKRSGSTIAIPSTPYSNYANDRTTSQLKWFVEYIKTETDFNSMQAFLGYLDAMTFRALWLSEGSVSDTVGGTSSRNVVENLSSQRDTSQIVLMQQIMDNVIMEQIVKPAMAINMPWYEGRLEMKTLGFGQDDEDITRQFFQLVGQQDYRTFGIDARRLADSKGFPMIGDPEFAKFLKDREEKAAQIGDQTMTPPVEPTQGRRARVTQTGFNEMTYHQLNDPIDARSRADGDFVASLPRDGVWSSREAVDAARILRSASQDFLEHCTRDLSLLLSKKQRAASEALDETARTYEVDRWFPRGERIDDLLEKSGRALQRARPKGDDRWTVDQSAAILTELSDAVRYDALADTVSSTYTIASRVARDVVESARAAASVDEVRSSDARWAQLDDGEVVLSDDLDGTRLARALSKAPQDLEVRRTVLDDEHLARFDEEAGVILLSTDLAPEQERQFLLALGDRLTA
jgi:ribosomal protein L31E